MAAHASHEQQYFKKLLGNPEAKAKKVESYLKLAQTTYEQKIRCGIEQVKQTSDNIQIRKSQTLPKSEVQNIRYMKKNLEKNLEIIDSRLDEITQTDKKSVSLTLTNEDRLKFVNQMIKARKELDINREKKLKDQQARQKQQHDRDQELQKKKQEEVRQKKKQEIMKRAESLQVVRKSKQLESEMQKKQLKLKLEEKILSDRMIQKFKQSQENVLAQRKKKLAEIRMLHKPLTKSDFQLHLQKIEKLKSQRSRVLEKDEVAKCTTKMPNNYYKSKWYNMSKNEQKEYEDQKHEEEVEQMKQMKDKLKKYSQYVKQKFKPEMDTKKVQERKGKEKSAILMGHKTEDLRQIGLKYLQYSKQHIDHTKRNAENENSEENSERRTRPKPKNYLEEIKIKNKGARKPHEVMEQMKRKKLPQAEKAQKILQFIEGLERKVKMREQKGRINKAVVDEELDNMLMEAIDLKLQILGEEES